VGGGEYAVQADGQGEHVRARGLGPLGGAAADTCAILPGGGLRPDRGEPRPHPREYAGAIAYLVYPTTLLGFAVWNWLLGRYPAASVAPLTLLVPVFGMASSVAVLHEALPP
jgi:drug/metabolite transporter (DMT)-like permease